MYSYDIEQYLPQLGRENNLEMIERLSDLRANQPILERVLTGPRTGAAPVWIAKQLGLPHQFVMDTLRRYKGEGMVLDVELTGAKEMRWLIDSSSHRELAELWLWWHHQNRQGGLTLPESEG